MIKVICDRCEKECDRIGFEIRASLIHNHTPRCATDVGDLKITDKPKMFRFVLCQECYAAMGFPHFGEGAEGKLYFRNVGGAGNG